MGILKINGDDDDNDLISFHQLVACICTKIKNVNKFIVHCQLISSVLTKLLRFSSFIAQISIPSEHMLWISFLSHKLVHHGLSKWMTTRRNLVQTDWTLNNQHLGTPVFSPQLRNWIWGKLDASSTPPPTSSHPSSNLGHRLVTLHLV